MKVRHNIKIFLLRTVCILPSMALTFYSIVHLKAIGLDDTNIILAGGLGIFVTFIMIQYSFEWFK
jgi:hypothetical protein